MGDEPTAVTTPGPGASDVGQPPTAEEAADEADEEPTDVRPLDDNRGRPTTATGDEPTVLAPGVQLTPTWVAPAGRQRATRDDEAQRTMVIQPARPDQQKGSSDGFDEPTQRFTN